MRGVNRAAAPVFASLLALLAAQAAATEILFDPADRSKTIFPSDAFTVVDFTQNTFRRVKLAKPDCSRNQVRCDDIDVLNGLDGFNTQPRITIPFSGPIDTGTVSSDTVFLVNLGSTVGFSIGSFGEKIGINQAVWDQGSNTLYVESDRFLEQHTRYAVIVTSGVKDKLGAPIQDSLPGHGASKAAVANEVVEDVLQAVLNARPHLGAKVKVVGAAVFTTMSVSSDMEKIQDQVAARAPGAVDFNVVQGGGRAYFPLSSITDVSINAQVVAAPVLAPPVSLFIPALFNILGPNVVGALAFGKFSSPNYLLPDVTIPALGSRSGVPVPQGTNEIHFNVAMPASAKPATGYPVAIFGHGFTDNKLGAFRVVAATMAKAGIATIGINVVGHGFGALTTYTVTTTGGTFTVPGGGRGFDQNGDGAISSTEGSSSAAPRVLIGSSDALRQTTIDLMQLVRQIKAGIDVDGDGTVDLDPSRIYYFGQSFGGIYGTIFLGTEPSVRVGVPNVGGGPIAEIIRLSPGFRPLAESAVFVRGLSNAGAPNPPDPFPPFSENMPLRNEPVRLNADATAIPIQEFFDQLEWGNQRGSPVAYAPYVRKSPLRGNPAKNVIVQFGKGDQTVPNPTQTALVRAGGLDDRVTYYRNDLAFAAGSPVKNPHTFLTNITVPGLAGLNAAQAQGQIATFFASDGAVTIDPDGAGPLFETPIVPPLPETLNFIP
jgi:hypothetical protein